MLEHITLALLGGVLIVGIKNVTMSSEVEEPNSKRPDAS